MRHSITFGTKNTWTDWHIIPMQQPVFAVPQTKTKILEINGANGVIDLSDAVTGYPVYGNRQGSFSFLSPARYTEWLHTYSEIVDYLHGLTMWAILEDDPNWHYEGRFAVNQMACDEQHGTIVIDYDVGPFKWSNTATNEPWLWDPFSFVDGVVYTSVYYDESTTPPTLVYSDNASVYGSIAVSTTAVALTFTEQETGRAPVQPAFRVNSDNGVTVSVKVGTDTVASVTVSPSGAVTIPSLVMWYGQWLYNGQIATVSAATASGTSELGLTFRVGRL